MSLIEMNDVMIFIIIIIVPILIIISIWIKISNKNEKKFEINDNQSQVEPEHVITQTAITLKTQKNPIFIDTETTGLHSDDQIVTLGLIRIVNWPDNFEGRLKLTSLHFVFDPFRKSHKEAEKVHGLDDWMLRHQEPFGARAAEIVAELEKADCYVGHNIEFDLKFLARSLEMYGYKLPEKPFYCTMKEARAQDLPRVSLKYCVKHYSLGKQNTVHSALYDAHLCMRLWLYWVYYLETESTIKSSYDNFIEPPEHPEILPRRSNVQKKNEALKKYSI